MKSKYNKKNVGIILLLGATLFALYYFSKSTLREGITQAQYTTLKDALTPTPEQEKLKQDQATLSTQKNNIAELAKKIQLDTKSYNEAVKAYNETAKKVADQLVALLPVFQSQFSKIQSIGITDDIYSLLIADTGNLEVPTIVNYLEILVNDEVNIVG